MRPLLLVLLCFCTTLAQTQNRSMSISELWQLYNSSANDSIKVNTLRHLATQYTRVNPDSAIILAQTALHDARENNFITLEAHAYTSLGEAYDVSGQIDSSIANFAIAIESFQRLDNQDGLGRAYNSRGLAYYYSGQNDEALSDFLLAQRISDSQKNLAQQARNLHNLGLAYSRSTQDSAVFLTLRSYLQARNLKDSLVHTGSSEISVQEQLSTYVNLSAFYIQKAQFNLARESLTTALGIATDEQLARKMGIYYNLGTIEELDSNFVKADSLYRISLDLALEGNMIPRQPFIYDALGNVARKQGTSEQASTFYQQALLILQDINRPDIKAAVLIDQGNLFFDQGNFINAKSNAEEGLAFAEQYNIQQQRIDAYSLLARIAEAQGDPAEAAKQLRNYTDLKEIADNESKKQELIGLQAVMDVELEKEKGQRRLDALKKDYYLNLIKGLIGVLLLISIFTIALAIARRSLLKSNRQLEITNTLLSEQTVDLATSEQKLKIASNKLQQFAFATGHDLKESLRNITSFTQLASITMAENLSDAQAHLKQASAGGKRMRKMLDDLLHYSNLGGDDTVKAAFPIQEVVSSIKEQLKEDILSTRGDIQQVTPVSLKANRNEIEQLFFNLVHNAIRYRQAGVPPRIQIKAEKINNEVVFKIKDNGMGIPMNEQQTIFKPFHRLHNRSQSGSGLGLSICQKVVQSYGGKIWYEAAEGGGSVFCFTIPKAQPKGQF